MRARATPLFFLRPSTVRHTSATAAQPGPAALLVHQPRYAASPVARHVTFGGAGRGETACQTQATARAQPRQTDTELTTTDWGGTGSITGSSPGVTSGAAPGHYRVIVRPTCSELTTTDAVDEEIDGEVEEMNELEQFLPRELAARRLDVTAVDGQNTGAMGRWLATCRWS